MIRQKIIEDKLKKYHQNHLDNGKTSLEEIKKIDFKLMDKLFQDSKKNIYYDTTKVTLLKYINRNNKYDYIGNEIISQNQYAIVLLAGGSASRLNLNIPKGCLEINVKNKKISLFELYINQLKETYNKYKIYINVYIMTSKTNNDTIVNYFKSNNYFDYPKKNIKFFQQNELPLIDTNGCITLKEDYSILYGPSGNGDVYNSMKQSGILNDIIKNKTKYVLFTAIDNVKVKLIDESFIGNIVYNKVEVGTKVISMPQNENERLFCKYKNKVDIISPEYLDDILIKKIKENNYYHKNIAYHILSTELLIKLSNKKLPYHRAYKSYVHISPIDNKITNEKVFKFEQFIFDGFKYANDMILYKIDKDEFCSIKTQEDIKIAEKELNK